MSYRVWRSLSSAPERPGRPLSNLQLLISRWAAIQTMLAGQWECQSYTQCRLLSASLTYHHFLLQQCLLALVRSQFRNSGPHTVHFRKKPSHAAVVRIRFRISRERVNGSNHLLNYFWELIWQSIKAVNLHLVGSKPRGLYGRC